MSKINKYISQIRIIILLITACALFLYTKPSQILNETVNRIYYSLITDAPDSNVVIIYINQEDIEKAGGWPISRNYYSLIIEKLSALNCRKIGIEIFLSAKNNTDSDKILTGKIITAGNIVLSSVFSAYSSREQSAELLLPHPKILMPEIQTGHINYYERDGIHIPLMFQSSLSEEPAFSLALSDPDSNMGMLPSIIKINFFTAWNKFRSFSLTEFVELVQTGSPQLQSLKDKIILLGVSSPQTAQSTSTHFDNYIPGVAIHAFAVDNILQRRFIRTQYEQFSSFIFILILIIIILFNPGKNIMLTYSAALIIFLITGLILFRIFFFEQNYSMFIVPLMILFVFDIVRAMLKRKSID